MSDRSLPYVLLLGAIFGSSMVVSRFSLGQYDPRTFVSLRLLLAALAYLLVYLFARSRSLPRDPKLWLKAGFLGIFGTALTLTAWVSALQYMSSGVSSLLLTLSPVLVVVLGPLFLADERLTWRRGLGVFVAFAGAGALILRGETGLGDLGGADPRGYAWVAVGLLGTAGSSIYAHRYLRGANALDVASIRMIAAALVLVPVVLLTVGYDLSKVQTSGWLALLYGGLIGGFAAYLLSFHIVKRFGATASSLTTYVIPVVTTILGAIFLKERLTPLVIGSMVVIFIGVTLLNSGPKPAPKAPPGPDA